PDHSDGDSGGGHSHGGSAPSGSQVVAPPVTDPFGGRGSPGLDRLVSLTGLSATGELAAATFVNALAEASDEDYEAWLYWMRSTGQASHSHAGSSSGDEVEGGHGGHSGPSPWTALTDPVECKKLADELELARETALRYPTV